MGYIPKMSVLWRTQSFPQAYIGGMDITFPEVTEPTDEQYTRPRLLNAADLRSFQRISAIGAHDMQGKLYDFQLQSCIIGLDERFTSIHFDGGWHAKTSVLTLSLLPPSGETECVNGKNILSFLQRGKTVRMSVYAQFYCGHLKDQQLDDLTDGPYVKVPLEWLQKGGAL